MIVDDVVKLSLLETRKPDHALPRPFVPQAEAVVGRPLTPVSYAGVARRTARRCADGVYAC